MSQQFNSVFEQKKRALKKLVASYGGIMVGKPSSSDIDALARLQARADLGEQLSEREIAKAKRLAAKFKGSFC